ncbi:MAG: AhpC/TSA family protein, partial [Acidimicrobiales bacterium]
MRQAYPDISALGAQVVAVSVGAPFQAEALMADGMPFPLLIDAERRVTFALGMKRSFFRALDPRGVWRYLKVMLRGHRPHRVVRVGLLQMPGVAILASDGRPLTVHRGRFEGDYPPLEAVLRQLADAMALHQQ